MDAEKPRVPAVDGLFEVGADGALHLLGSRCESCGTWSFPRKRGSCPNPACAGTEQREVPLGRRGRLWSYTDARYAPPPPFAAKDPHEPFCIAAVELDDERMIVLGQVVDGVALGDLSLGMPMELVADVLEEREDRVLLVWKWKPVREVAS